MGQHLRAAFPRIQESRNSHPGQAILGARSLRRLFLDLMGRPPYHAERVAWSSKQRIDLIDWALAREEFWANWLEEQLYFFLLVDSFRPTSEVRALPAQIVDGCIDVREALHRICLSSSFDRRNPGADTFVTVVMEQLLGMKVQKNVRELEIGKRVYDGTNGVFLGQHGKSQADVVNIAIDDRRFWTCLLRREFERWMRRNPSDMELNCWSSILERENSDYGSLLRAWFSSEDYDSRLQMNDPQPNRVFIRALFVDLFGRLPENDEARRVGNALDGLADPAPLRSLLARVMLDSGAVTMPEKDAIADPTVWIRELFERLLGRLPDVAEQDAFLQGFQDQACRPATVVYAIVSHPEYQMW